MDERSETAMTRVMPDVANRVRAGAELLQEQGTYLCVIEGFRTWAQQNLDYAQGRTTNPLGHIITRARGGQSPHNFGMAVDVVPYLRGDGGKLNWKANSPQFQAMVEALKAQGLAWGGDWPGDLGDFDHFQLAGLPATPSEQMQADYQNAVSNPEIGEANALQAIWREAAQGRYGKLPQTAPALV
jgi:peptidoglycan L-alanyl-D-glutamate endopeptidase CwlK